MYSQGDPFSDDGFDSNPVLDCYGIDRVGNWRMRGLEEDEPNFVGATMSKGCTVLRVMERCMMTELSGCLPT